MTSIKKRFQTAASIAGVFAFALAVSTAAFADVPTDIVPRSSGVYDALAVLAEGHLLPPGDDAETFLGDTARLRSRAEVSSMIDAVRDNDDESGMTANQTAALEFLSAYLSDPTVADHTPHWRNEAGYGADVMGEVGGQKNNGDKSQAFGDGFGNLRVYGTSGSAYFTAGVSNFYQQRTDYLSFNTRNGGFTPDDEIDQRNGLQEAYVAWQGSRGLKVDIGVKSRNWGPGYTGDMMLSDNAPAMPGMELDVPLWLGHSLKLFRFTQIQEAYDNVGQYIYAGVRRLEHPLNPRLDIDAQESYTSDHLVSPAIIFLPYYLYQHDYIHGETQEPLEFNYQAQAGLTYKTAGDPNNGDVYLQFFIDDIQSPQGIGLGNHVPRKIGYMLGVNQTYAPTGTSVVAEYLRTDPETYTKTDIREAPLSLFVDDLPIGSPIGPNGQELYGRLGQKLSNRLDLAVAGAVRRRVNDSFPAPDDTLVSASLAYHVTSSQSVAVRYAEFHEDPYTGTFTIPSASGGADYGVTERQKVAAVDYLIAF